MLQDGDGNIVMLKSIFGKPPLIITQNPDDFETVYRHDGIWPYRKGFELLNYHRNVHRVDYFGVESGLVTSQDKAWGNMCSAVNPIIIQPKNVKLYLGALDSINQQFLKRIKLIRDPETLEMPANFKDEISAWTLESLGRVALDRQLGLIDNTNAEGLKPSLWRQFKTPKLRDVLSVLDEGLEITDKFVQEAMERIEKSTEEKLEKLLAINRKYAVVMALDMMFGGVDTTTSTFAAMVLALAQHPDKQEKLRTEILGILPEKDTPLTVESMKNLPYLLFYPLTSANVRSTRQELVLSSYTVPPGSEIAMVHLNLWRDEQHFSQPDQFIPERWLRQKQHDSSGSNGRPMATKSSHPFAYLPFGFGSRSCIGRRIAEMELEVGVSRLLRNFQVEFHHPADKPFIAYQLSMPSIPLQFKFIDLKD
ncbi:cytochrome P450 CYP12A2-like [Drosophila montana]|uniref:cytochrome P450 CYP12A2-like n=1 Tax=Drosophila montana TaxID=40370 RepID=UPI00313BA7E3